MTAVNIVLAMNPIGLIVAAIMLLIAAIIAVIYWWDEIKAKIMETSDVAILAVGLILAPVGLLVAAAALVMKHWEPLSAFFKSLGEGIASVFNFILDGVIMQINIVLDMIRGVVSLGQNLGAVSADVTVPRIASMRSEQRRQPPKTIQGLALKY